MMGFSQSIMDEKHQPFTFESVVDAIKALIALSNKLHSSIENTEKLFLATEIETLKRNKYLIYLRCCLKFFERRSNFVIACIQEEPLQNKEVYSGPLCLDQSFRKDRCLCFKPRLPSAWSPQAPKTPSRAFCVQAKNAFFLCCSSWSIHPSLPEPPGRSWYPFK